jgi:membrane protein YqaA with SNARE-associated domain
LKSIKLALTKFGAKLSAILLPLGAWGVFAIAALDGLGVPTSGGMDAFFIFSISSVHDKPWRICLYVLATAVGSTLGCAVLYGIGYEGGEALLRKRMSPEKFERTRLSFEKNRVLALMVPAMLPPPFPFKVFVLSAAVFEMKLQHFLAAIFAGRLIRFGATAALIYYFGPGIVAFVTDAFKHHLGLVLLAAGAAVGIWWLVVRLRRGAPGTEVTA